MNFRLMLKWILPVAGAAFTVIAYESFSMPEFWMAIGWVVCFVGIGVISQQSVGKAISLNIAFLFLVIAAVEGYAQWSLSSDPTRVRKEIIRGGKRFDQKDEVLGYAPIPNQTARVTKTKGSEIIFDVTFTIDADGLRIAPPSAPVRDCPSLLFFGGSFTYGYGVNDHEAMPYRVGQLTGCPVYNFGYGGYGPHQMLAAIEKKRVAAIVAKRPAIAVYQTGFGHTQRLTGGAIWDTHGPKYVLRADGSAEYEGHFDDSDALFAPVNSRLKQTGIYRKFVYPRLGVEEQDVRLYIAVIEASRQKLKEQYPEIAFHMIIWDFDHPDPSRVALYQMWHEELSRRGFHLHFISKILPGYVENEERYTIIGDGHPTALAQRLIAEYVKREIWAPTMTNRRNAS